jgi:hypothetical protein
VAVVAPKKMSGAANKPAALFSFRLSGVAAAS